jgi:hypothetical protein
MSVAGCTQCDGQHGRWDGHIGCSSGSGGGERDWIGRGGCGGCDAWCGRGGCGQHNRVVDTSDGLFGVGGDLYTLPMQMTTVGK